MDSSRISFFPQFWDTVAIQIFLNLRFTTWWFDNMYTLWSNHHTVFMSAFPSWMFQNQCILHPFSFPLWRFISCISLLKSQVPHKHNLLKPYFPNVFAKLSWGTTFNIAQTVVTFSKIAALGPLIKRLASKIGCLGEINTVAVNRMDWRQEISPARRPLRWLLQ